MRNPIEQQRRNTGRTTQEHNCWTQWSGGGARDRKHNKGDNTDGGWRALEARGSRRARCPLGVLLVACPLCVLLVACPLGAASVAMMEWETLEDDVTFNDPKYRASIQLRGASSEPKRGRRCQKRMRAEKGKNAKKTPHQGCLVRLVRRKQQTRSRVCVPTRPGLGISPLTTTEQVWNRPLLIGSDCTGLDSASVALRLLGVPHHIVFASERHLKTRAVFLANANNQPEHFSNDLMTRGDEELPSRAFHLDLYTSGPPCQPFSSEGLQRGVGDHRGVVFLQVLRTIRLLRPRCFIIENVATLKHQKFRRTYGLIREQLEGILDAHGVPFYHVMDTIMDTSIHGGLPQTRRRLYLVGWNRSDFCAEFRWPAPIPQVTLSSLLDESAQKGPAELPPRVAANLAKAAGTIAAALQTHPGYATEP